MTTITMPTSNFSSFLGNYKVHNFNNSDTQEMVKGVCTAGSK